MPTFFLPPPTLPAAAVKAETDCFVTLDKKHFLKDPQIEKKAKLKILSPRQFLKGS